MSENDLMVYTIMICTAILLFTNYETYATTGTIDSSGMRIWYIDTPREHEAGILEVGYAVHPYMVVPPHAKNFTITGLTIDECTSKVQKYMNIMIIKRSDTSGINLAINP